MTTRRTSARALIPMALAAGILFSLAPATPASAAVRTEGQRIVRIAKNQVADPWRYGATGPTAFDCSGLVIYAYRKAGEGQAIKAGTLRSARSMYLDFKRRGKTSRKNPHKGDLVVWGGGSHIGIYIGRGKAVSTLRNGVRVHGVHAVTAEFTAYIHTGMSTKPLG